VSHEKFLYLLLSHRCVLLVFLFTIILEINRVEGTRLDRDASADVPRLCGVAVNAYLTMLLDTGTLQ